MAFNPLADSLRRGSGSPEGAVTGQVGDTYRRTDGTTNTTFYVKTSGTGNTGWTAFNAQGIAGLTWLGAYNALTPYIINDAVTYQGSSYRCILASLGNAPTNQTFWDVIASKGDAGAGGTPRVDQFIVSQAGTTLFALSHTALDAAAIVLYFNGVAHFKDIDFTATTTQVTWLNNGYQTAVGDEIVICYES